MKDKNEDSKRENQLISRDDENNKRKISFNISTEKTTKSVRISNSVVSVLSLH
jgi:hypothetical protein